MSSSTVSSLSFAIMPSVVQTPLPIDAHVAEIAAHVRAHRSAVIVAPPGSGKTTRIPPALAALGRTILLQPRRMVVRLVDTRSEVGSGRAVGNQNRRDNAYQRRGPTIARVVVG